jgi:predicted dehydrogenase
MWSRLRPAFKKAHEWAWKEGRIGNLCGSKASLCARRGAEEYPRLFDPARGGGALLDLGIYCLHFARLFAGNRNLLNCKSISIPGKCGVDLSDFILLEYSGGFTADLSCSIDFSVPNDAYVFGEAGYIRIAPWFNTAGTIELYTTESGNSEDPVFSERFNGASGFEFQINHFLDCIREGKKESDMVPLADTIEAMELIDKILA